MTVLFRLLNEEAATGYSGSANDKDLLGFLSGSCVGLVPSLCLGTVESVNELKYSGLGQQINRWLVAS